MGYKYYKLRYLLSLATVLSVPLGVIKSSPATEANNFFLNKSSWSKSSVHKFSRKFDIAPDITPDISLDIPVNNSIPSPLSPQYLFSQSPNQSESEDPNTRKVIIPFQDYLYWIPDKWPEDGTTEQFYEFLDKSNNKKKFRDYDSESDSSDQ